MCREEKQNGELFLPLASHLARASLLTGVPERSLIRFQNIKSTENKIRKVRSDKLDVDDFEQSVIRRTINDMLVSRKVLPTVKTLLRELQSHDSINFNGGKETLCVQTVETNGINLEKMFKQSKDSFGKI